MAYEVDSWEDHLDNLFKREEVGNRDTEVSRRDTDNWKVIKECRDEPTEYNREIGFSLPAAKQVVLPLYSSLQAIGDTSGMLSTMLAIMVIDFAAFPIHERS
ncbi:hypothetical protein PIB30_001608 [Stylosanthes scabra]|uniref:Uncharacterized protein n=1 Tax=Stylosanthes scabra TaxID=79078 RepID=A0ABU6S281_9FABA|nr:hypothetical protein [Stylosanthes scabra]